jgi:RHS repeat-associated protein
MVDGLGSTRLLANGSGSIVARFAYDAFGGLLGTAIGALNPPATPILFTGQQVDATLLQYYLRARYYSPYLGRFDGMDPVPGDLGSPISFNRYVYASLDPVNVYDPSGQDGESIGTLTAIGIGVNLISLYFNTIQTLRAKTAAGGLFRCLTRVAIPLDPLALDAIPREIRLLLERSRIDCICSQTVRAHDIKYFLV